MGWSPLIHTRFHVPRTTLDTASLISLLTGLSPSLVRLPRRFSFNRLIDYAVLNPHSASRMSLGSSYFARHYFRNRVFFFFLQVHKMFQFPTFPSYTLLYSCMDKPASSWFEFPHSDIHGSKDICSLPWLFAAYHVLLRLLVPRYPPYALCSLTLNAFAFTV